MGNCVANSNCHGVLVMIAQKINISEAPTTIKLTVTLFLMGIGLSYLFGFLMVIFWVGLWPYEVIKTYTEENKSFKQTANVITDQPIDLNEMETTHTIDQKLLIQDSHIHLPVYAIIAAILSLITTTLNSSKKLKLGLIFLLFLGGWLDFLGMWGVKYLANAFAYVTLTGGWLMFGSWLIVTILTFKQMWFL